MGAAQSAFRKARGTMAKGNNAQKKETKKPKKNTGKDKDKKK